MARAAPKLAVGVGIEEVDWRAESEGAMDWLAEALLRDEATPLHVPRPCVAVGEAGGEAVGLREGDPEAEAFALGLRLPLGEAEREEAGVGECERAGEAELEVVLVEKPEEEAAAVAPLEAEE